MSSSTKKSIRFSQTTNKNTQKTLRRSSSFVKNLPRKTLNSKPLPSLESSSSSRGNQEQKHVWIEDEQQKWILCQLLRQEGPSILLKNLQTNQVFTFDSSFKEIFPHDPNVTSDMVTLRGLSEPSILNNLKERSFSKQPYTYMGTILISVNPFEWYDFPEIEQFKGRFMNPTTPHPYAIAEHSYQQICSTRALDHAVVISGESGAGKTENAHMVLSYLVNRATATTDSTGIENQNHVEEKLLKSSPILEAFGNAKTSRNSNSSRFGKFMKIFFTSESLPSEKPRKISHASIETYLLEKSRVTSQIAGEDNFHVFYVLLAALGANENFLQSIHLSSTSPSAFSILSNSSTAGELKKNSSQTPKKGNFIRQSSFAQGSHLEQFHSVMNAMMTLGHNEDVILSIWRAVGAILELGNIQFQDVDTSEGQASHIDNHVHVTHAAELLEINVNDLITLFTKRVVVTVGEKITKSLTAEESFKTKNAFIKALYSNLFHVLVTSLNSSLRSTTIASQPSQDLHSIGILDIFGFESFQRNEFEQLLINYANESLQNTFNEQIFQNELKLYREEEIKVNLSVEECPSNSFCVNLIYSSRTGSGNNHQSIISILHSVAQSPKGSDEMFCESLHKIIPNNPSPIIRRYFPPVHPKDRKVLFTINHFAGSVTYHVGEKGQNIWLNKNHDTIPEDMFPVLTSSHSEFIRSLAIGGQGNQTSKQRKQSIADIFSQSMTELCQTLKTSDCSFIRCIKPNKSSVPAVFDTTYVIPQMRALGLVQVCEVMKVGLTKRISFDELKNLNPEITAEIAKSIPHESGEAIAAILLWALEIPDDSYYIGKSRVFFKSYAGSLYDRLLETKHSLTEEVMSKILQAIQVRKESKGIIDTLEKKSTELLNQFQTNQQKTNEIIEKLTRCDTQFTSLSKECRIIASVIPKIVKKLSTVETSVQEIKEHVLDIKTHSEFSSIQESLQLIDSQLNNCDDIWSKIDTKLNILTTFIATQPIDLLRNHRAEISNELTAIEELFPDVHRLIQKTIEEANRCQLSKFGKRAEDCEYNLDLVQQRLEINTEEIQELHGKFQTAQTDLDSMSVSAREISSHQQNATGVSDNITKLCTDIRKKASIIRLKLIRDEEERVRVENEIKEREEKIHQEMLLQEENSQRLQREEELSNRRAALAELEREGDVSFDPSSMNDDGLELPPGWEWNHEKQLYFNLLTREYQVDVPTLPAMSHQNTGIDEIMDNTTLDEVTEYDFDGIRVYTFVDPEPSEIAPEGNGTETNRTSRVMVETIYDSEKKPSAGEEKVQGTKKVVKEVSYMYDGIRIYTTKEIDESELNENANDKDNEEKQKMDAIKQQSLNAELNQKISRVFKEGYLQKQGKYFGSWRKLYFVVSGNSIAHYSSKQSYQCGALPTKIIQLTGLSVLSYTKFNLCFTVHTGGRTYWTMMAEDKAEFQQWMEKLNTVIGALFDSRIQACLTPSAADDYPELF